MHAELVRRFLSTQVFALCEFWGGIPTWQNAFLSHNVKKFVMANLGLHKQERLSTVRKARILFLNFLLKEAGEKWKLERNTCSGSGNRTPAAFLPVHGQGLLQNPNLPSKSRFSAQSCTTWLMLFDDVIAGVSAWIHLPVTFTLTTFTWVKSK